MYLDCKAVNKVIVHKYTGRFFAQIKICNSPHCELNKQTCGQKKTCTCNNLLIMQ